MLSFDDPYQRITLVVCLWRSFFSCLKIYITLSLSQFTPSALSNTPSNGNITRNLFRAISSSKYCNQISTSNHFIKVRWELTRLNYSTASSSFFIIWCSEFFNPAKRYVPFRIFHLLLLMSAAIICFFSNFLFNSVISRLP